ncbi:MAG: hypothetical protein KC777_20200 [Cyanobacteria bacterium HKST-UBA02]|nr:hypothetical protein [Cyanobacteria bacterium HKST-UBA02]
MHFPGETHLMGTAAILFASGLILFRYCAQTWCCEPSTPCQSPASRARTGLDFAQAGFVALGMMFAGMVTFAGAFLGWDYAEICTIIANIFP